MKYELFRGYIRTVSKKAIEKFKNVPIHSLEEVRECSEYAGVLNENTVLIDVDNGKEAETVLKIVRDLELRCRVIQTTRGYHFLFLNNGEISGCPIKVIAVCGITIDVKIGDDKAAYEVLKYKEKERKVVYDISDDVDYQTVPKFLLPLRKEYKTSLFNLDEGDGRNDALYAHILECQKIGLKKDDIKDIFRNIINEYIFKKPLPESELKTILRDEAFSQTINIFTDEKGKKFCHNKLGSYMVEKYHVIKTRGALYAYDESKGYYRLDFQNGESFLESRMIDLIDNIDSKKRSETMKYIRLKAAETEWKRNNRYICFKNGILDIEDMVLKKHTPDIFLTFQIPHNYNPTSLSSKLVEKTYNEWMSLPGLRVLEEELSGISLIDSTRYQTAVILYGPKSNGKSSYLNLKKRIFGEENCGSISLERFGDRFSLSSLEEKPINMAAELPAGFIHGKTIAQLKKVISGDTIFSEKKGKDGYSIELSCMHWFSANQMPTFEDDTGAVGKRFIVLPFLNTFEAGNNVLDIVEQFSETDIEYLLNLYIDGLRRLKSNKNKFTECKKSIELNDALIKRIKSLKDYIKELNGSTFSEKTTQDIFEDYRTYCRDNEIDGVKKEKFSRTMTELGFEIKDTTRTIEGKKIHLKYYMRK